MSRYDVVVYGASGFTGAYIVQYLVTSSHFEGVTYAVAGRSESKLRQVLSDISDRTGRNVRSVPLIEADSADEDSLAAMARQAKVVINAVGPYRLYGEAVVKACVENGANHLDISGEPAWIEQMQAKYSKEAEKQGVFVVSACGWDSIPADLGVNYLKKNFGGDLNHVESFVQIKQGPAGYSFNAGTYQTLILGISGALTDKLGAIRKQIMPEKIVRGAVRVPKRGTVWEIKEKELDGYALPFPGADKSVINRSQYYDATVNQKRPIHMETYIRVSSMFWAVVLGLWVTVFSVLVKWPSTRKFLQQYPDLCSFHMFKNSGPNKEQMAQASFVYWFFGYGYSESKPQDEQHEEKINRKVVSTCKGPDAGYIATSGCILSSALAVLKDRKNLPKEGGVYTTAAAFGNSNIYEYLESFGVTFQIEGIWTDEPLRSHILVITGDMQLQLFRRLYCSFGQPTRFKVLLSAHSKFLASNESFSTLQAVSTKLIPLSSIPQEKLGHSILIHKDTLPKGSPKTAHDIVATGVFAAKVLSLSSSIAGVVMVPVLSSYLWEAAAERPNMMLFAIVANTFLVLLSFTPILLHFLAKRFPINIYYDHTSKIFTTVHYNFLMRKMALRFESKEVVDAQMAPEMKKIWIPLATAFVHKKPLLISLDRNAYVDKLAFDELTRNIEIPPNHD
ncbi:unnamed protein product [Caenorhabditis auriculariae]|uniref:Saccharopine dehydrogenase NADP binding domain-containing protein n=1 Tax=Caenorhabditis auriculariae TaxID=2777116 RepID=A0A8S1HIB8_9PELO|nr:unnamed protein product [Caenorhabditis auriculariae]